MSRSLRAMIRAARAHAASHPDGERGQAAIRVAIGVAFYLYFWGVLFHQVDTFPPDTRVVSVGFLLAALVLALVALRSTRPSPARRIAGILLDVGTASYLLVRTGEAGSPLLAVYLWVSLGNGFRYGAPYLLTAAAIAIAGLVWVFLSAPFWQQHIGVAVAFLVTMVAVPAYTVSLLRRLHSAVHKAQQASVAKTQFLASMSHELRTPLNGVIGTADLLGETRMDQEQQQLVGVIRSSADALLQLIEKILDISKIESGRMESIVEEYDLHEVVRGVVGMLTPQAKNKGLVLACHIAPQTPFQLKSDSRHLRQVLVNLIGNAIKFTVEGRVDLYLSPAGKIGEHMRVRFEVVDSGIGIAEEANGRVFELFSQADQSVTRRFGGAGLGLNIAKQLVELMGGEIGFRSEEGAGSTFWFEVPVEQRVAGRAGRASAAAKLATMRVGVLASPGPTARIRTLVANWGGETVEVAEADLDAWAKGRADRLDALVVDARALEDDPGQLIGKAQQGAETPSVILLDNPATGRTEQEWLRAGYASVLYEPLNPTLLYNALHAWAPATALPPNVASLAEHYRIRAGQRRRLNVLVAEDNRVNQQLLKRLLERAGHEATVAENGEEALTLLDDGVVRFDLAIIDMHMPGMSGVDLIKRWRFLETGHLPIIMLTADATTAAETACREAGADAFLTKPINGRTLLDAVARAVGDAVQDKAPVKTAAGAGQELDHRVLQELEAIGGDDGFLADLIGGFEEDADRAIAEAREAMARQDPGVWKDALHALKGSALDVGAMALADLCRTAERMAPSDIGRPAARERLQAVEAALAKARTAIGQYLAHERRVTGV